MFQLDIGLIKATHYLLPNMDWIWLVQQVKMCKLLRKMFEWTVLLIDFLPRPSFDSIKTRLGSFELEELFVISECMILCCSFLHLPKMRIRHFYSVFVILYSSLYLLQFLKVIILHLFVHFLPAIIFYYRTSLNLFSLGICVYLWSTNVYTYMCTPSTL